MELEVKIAVAIVSVVFVAAILRVELKTRRLRRRHENLHPGDRASSS
jgi:hypothetical protein